VHKRRTLEVVLLAVKDAGAFKVVLLLRLGPIPYSITNYTASLSPDIGVVKYWTASMIGVIPHVIINTYLGRSIGGISQLLQCELHVALICRNTAAIKPARVLTKRPSA